ncbi:hypothetical protein M8C21_028353 [Ambrosia artemisiifolia]|uniref:Uncharacterized protein n=1 Tax=Ambrosia artemisiifolia TaxID=4212 RepID=A0AAD5CDB7_AMBAR|nr:hypothetical protein M8C21_028353 [Ambrosia artemisiifolia]
MVVVATRMVPSLVARVGWCCRY